VAQFRRAHLLHAAGVTPWYRATVGLQALPGEAFARPGFAGRVMAAAEGREAFAPPGPSRAELLGMLA
jgi:hypothetical protein